MPYALFEPCSTGGCKNSNRFICTQKARDMMIITHRKKSVHRGSDKLSPFFSIKVHFPPLLRNMNKYLHLAPLFSKKTMAF